MTRLGLRSRVGVRSGRLYKSRINLRAPSRKCMAKYFPTPEQSQVPDLDTSSETHEEPTTEWEQATSLESDEQSTTTPRPKEAASRRRATVPARGLDMQDLVAAAALYRLSQGQPLDERSLKHSILTLCKAGLASAGSAKGARSDNSKDGSA